MKLKRLENGAYCFLVVIDPQQEEVRLGSIDPGVINADELILVPKSTLAGLIGAPCSMPETNLTAGQIKPTTPELPVADQCGESADEPVPSAQTAAIRTKPRREYRDDDLLTRREAAEYLGLGAQTLAIWKSTGRYDLPCVKVGRLVRYRKRELDKFIDRLNGGNEQQKRRGR